MTVLADHQFEILPSEEAASGYVFGIGADVTVETFDPGETTWLTQDAQNTRRGVTGFGRDITAGKTWLWETSTDKDDENEAVAVLDDFSDAWQPEESETPGWTTALRYSVAGRTRRIYGRPRRYAAPPTNLILNGYVPVSIDFSTVDGFTYDDVESSALIPYTSSASGGGIVLPAVLPASSLPSTGTGAEQLNVGGKARAYPIIRFNGPWTDPVIDCGDWTLKWTGVIPVGGYIEIDTRPWRLTVLDQSGASRVEGLDRRTWLEDCWFAPNSRPSANLGGIANGGSASALVRWRNTWKSI